MISTHEETAVHLLERQPDAGGSHRRDRQRGLTADHISVLGFWNAEACEEERGRREEEKGLRSLAVL